MDDTSLGVNEIGVAKKVLFIKDKDIRLLFLSLLKADDIYCFNVLIPNELGLLPTVLDSMFLYLRDF